MNKFIIVMIALTANVSWARAGRPKLCTTENFKTMHEAFAEMDASGITQELYSLSIGFRGGDCNNLYSLEGQARIPHPMNAPLPSCAIIFIVDESDHIKQATWILDKLGKVYKTASGGELPLCAELDGPRPMPGGTIHTQQ